MPAARAVPATWPQAGYTEAEDLPGKRDRLGSGAGAECRAQAGHSEHHRSLGDALLSLQNEAIGGNTRIP